jgi:hypothetical protein
MLEVHYYKSGEQLQGQCELREAWKFNDLKPRFYYCRGGSSHIVSKYMKPIAVALMEACGGTAMRKRTVPSNFLRASEDDFVTAWDFTAFTTSLQELRHFLDAICDRLEEEALYVTVFDYRLGDHQVELAELLREYNHTINIQDRYSVFRLAEFIDALGYNTSVHPVSFYQQNSGSLGIPGNIGFSTACHGWEICKKCGEHKCVCVGDDGLGITSACPESMGLIPSLQRMGTIHPEKWIMRTPHDLRKFPFLKRYIERDQTLLVFDILVDLPVAPYVDDVKEHRTVPPSFTEYKRVEKICTQVGALLLRLSTPGNFSQVDLGQLDLELLRLFLECIYRLNNLPTEGQLPGLLKPRNPKEKTISEMIVGFCVPPINGLHYVKEDWIDYLVSQNFNAAVTVPLFEPKRPPLITGQSFETTQHPFFSILEDLEIVTIQDIKERIVLDNPLSLHKFRRCMDPLLRYGGFSQVIIVNVIKDIPSQFNSYLRSNVVLSSSWAVARQI